MMVLFSRVLTICFLLGFLGDCSNIVSEQTQPEGRRSLMRNMFDKGEVLWVFGTENPEATVMYQELSKKIQGSIGEERLKILLKADTSVTSEDLANYPLFVTGTLKNEYIWQELLPGLPFQYRNDSLCTTINNFSLSENCIWTLSSYPNPYEQNFPLYLYTGISDTAIVNHLLNSDLGSWRGMFNNSWSYELYQDNKRMVMGYLKENDEGKWTFDPYNHWDYTVRFTEECVYDHFEVKRHGAVNEALLSELLSSLEKSCLALTQLLDAQQPVEPITLNVYSTAEDKGLQLMNTDQMHVDFEENIIYTSVHEAFKYPNILPANRLFLRSHLGTPTMQCLEVGFAAMYTDPWQGEKGKIWGRRLYEANALLSPEELISNSSFEQASRLIRQISSALWVDFLWKEWGKEKFITIYQGDSIDANTLTILKPKWEEYLTRLTYVPVNRDINTVLNSSEMLKGFNFAHEGYRIYNGYISRKAEESIEETYSHGANALAIIPYTGTRNVNSPQPFGFSDRAGSENDESVIFSTHYAHERGMQVMLKPQIWVRGAWPGDIKMNSQKDWNQFFEYYRDWIMHYALLAGLYDMSMFCVGVEMVHTTIEQPDQWINLIRDIRKIYPGKLIYAANWGPEFEHENHAFWKELDYIGIDCYYPLSESETATMAELKHNFETITHKLIAKSQKYDKPLIFTEIGFRSIEAPWQQPHDYPNGKPPNDEHQAMCYEVVADILQDQHWCKGIFWWKWSSYLEHTENTPTEYSPYGKPASQIVKKWFKEES